MEKKKSRLWNLFGAKKTGCCSVEIEEIPEEEEKQEDSCCSSCKPEPKNIQDSKKAIE
jgi:hypothetical protein